jgi:predicted nucleotidyltransferase component of viral defense system
MILDTTVKNLVDKYQTNELNIQREYFQHLFLSYFYRQPNSKYIFFKGGTALRIIFGSPRFSQDLDFNSAFISFKGIESLVLETLSSMEKENIKFILDEGKPTAGGFLSLISLEGFTKPLTIQLDISQRDEENKGEVVAITSDFVPPYNVISATKHQLVYEKVRALLERKKPRDFYDLYFILRKGLLKPVEKSVLPKTLQVLKESDINFDAELKEYLPKSHWAIIRDFKTILEREIENFL